VSIVAEKKESFFSFPVYIQNPERKASQTRPSPYINNPNPIVGSYRGSLDNSDNHPYQEIFPSSNRSSPLSGATATHDTITETIIIVED
jgi:hypothetical protein